MEWHQLAEQLRNWGRWGPDDEIGTLNLITPQSILRGVAAVRHGVVVSLAINFDRFGPAIPTRPAGRVNPIHYMTATPLDEREQAAGPRGEFRFLDDHVVMALQAGTQWDALAHVYYGGKFYNGYGTDVVTSRGVTKLGIEKWARGVVSRGVFFDVARARGVEWMQRGEAILVDDLEALEREHAVRVEAGDVVIVRTGWWAKFERERDAVDFWDGQPGISCTVLPWLQERGAAAIAMDNWGVEVKPDSVNAWEGFTFSPLHLIALRDMGLPLGEIWNLEALSRTCAELGQYAFLLCAAPLPFTGAVGSPLNPLAIL
jgi:kynurenine formamidase